MTKHIHPFRRALLLASSLALLTVLTGVFSLRPSFSPEGFPSKGHLFALSLASGALIASLPRRIRARHEKHVLPGWKSCAAAFAGGLCVTGASVISASDTLPLFTSAMQGSVGALAFVLCALLSGAAAARLFGRKRV